jgi:hypothetical protein
VERPKVLYNASTGVPAHRQPDYGEAEAGVATSSTPCGPYTYRGGIRRSASRAATSAFGQVAVVVSGATTTGTEVE